MPEDSPGAVRSRASLGADLVVGPGGIVWTRAGSGVVHEEIPAEPGRELHGVQIFVNLSAENKLTPPQVLYLQPDQVPQWHSNAGDRVRVVTGSFEGASSPLVPVEPFTLLDARLLRQITFDLPAAHNAVVYVLSGSVVARADGHSEKAGGGHALALRGSGRVTLEAAERAHLLVHTSPTAAQARRARAAGQRQGRESSAAKMSTQASTAPDYSPVITARGGHLQHERPHGPPCPGPPGRTARIGPVPSDEVGVPAQQGPRGDDQPQLAQVPAGQQPGQRCQDRPVGPSTSAP